jgi:cytochrome c biogenesis protein CcmG, thiol:disulfide interchange protein DsbE
MRLVMRAAAVGVVGVLFVLLVWRVVTNEAGHGLAAAVAAGKVPAAPNFALPRLDEPGTLRLSALRGRVVLLNFWASWCVPCSQEAPLLAQAWRRWRHRGVVFVGLDTQDFRSDARRFMHHFGISYPTVHDSGGTTVDRYGVSGFPETWFIARNGTLVVEHISGPLTAARVNRDLREALRS